MQIRANMKDKIKAISMWGSLLSIGLLVGCASQSATRSSLGVAHLKSNAHTYQGKSVALLADMNEFISDDLAKVDDDGLGGAELYVVRNEELSANEFRTLARAGRVLLEGDMGYFVKSDSGNRVELDEKMESALEGQPVFYARKITVLTK
ncbi:MAG: hypothetical protein R3C68_18545 [Myxococcota bacterium]